MSKLSMKTYYDKSLQSSPKGHGSKSRADLNHAKIVAEAGMIEGVAPHCYTQILKDFIQDKDLDQLTEDIRDQLAFLSMNSAAQKEAVRRAMMNEDVPDVEGFDQESKDLHYISMLRYFNDMVISYKKRDLVKNVALSTYALGAVLERRNQQGLTALEILMQEGLMTQEEYNMVDQSMNGGIPFIHSGYHMAAFIDEYEGITKVLAAKLLQSTSDIRLEEMTSVLADDILDALYNAKDKETAEHQIVQLLDRSHLLPEDYKPRMRVAEVVEDTAKVNMWSVPNGRQELKNNWARKVPMREFKQYDDYKKDDAFKFYENGNTPAGTSMIFDPRPEGRIGTVVHDNARFNEYNGNGQGNRFINREGGTYEDMQRRNLERADDVNRYNPNELYQIKYDDEYGDHRAPREEKDKFYDSLKAVYPNDFTVYYTEDQCPYEKSHREYDLESGEIFVVPHKREMGGQRRIYWSKPKPSGTTAMSPNLRQELGYNPQAYLNQSHFSNTGLNKREFNFNSVPKGNDPRVVQFDNGDRAVYVDGQGWAVRKFENQARSGAWQTRHEGNPNQVAFNGVYNTGTSDKDLRKNPFKRGNIERPITQSNNAGYYNSRNVTPVKEVKEVPKASNILFDATSLRGYAGRAKFDNHSASNYPYTLDVEVDGKIDRLTCIFEGIYWSDNLQRWMTGEYYQFIDQNEVEDFVRRYNLVESPEPQRPQVSNVYNNNQGGTRVFNYGSDSGYVENRNTGVREVRGNNIFRRGSTGNTMSGYGAGFLGDPKEATNSYQSNRGYYNDNRGGYREEIIWRYVGQGRDQYGNPVDIERNRYGEERYIPVNNYDNYNSNYATKSGREVIYV